MNFSLLPTLLLLVSTLWLSACKGSSQATTDAASDIDSTLITPIKFNADTAFAFVKAQCDFGPRTPNSVAIEKCGDYIAAQFERYGMSITNQRTTVKGWDGTSLKCRNIIAAYRPEQTDRIVLAAHYDSRPWVDADADSTKHKTQAVMAANDGASGVAVMLEIARQLALLKPEFGVDFICFDAEDYGAPYWAPESEQAKSENWCLGSQYWAKNPHKPGYTARLGILLDMVGGRDARFHYEGYSMKYAQDVMVRLWDAARYAGAADYFVQQPGGMVTDDHVPMNEIALIPTVDIIPFNPSGGFCPHWHTSHDTPENIDPQTLRAVGQTVMQFIATLPAATATPQ